MISGFVLMLPSVKSYDAKQACIYNVCHMHMFGSRFADLLDIIMAY
jgi:hypothetical protein